MRRQLIEVTHRVDMTCRECGHPSFRVFVCGKLDCLLMGENVIHHHCQSRNCCAGGCKPINDPEMEIINRTAYEGAS